MHTYKQNLMSWLTGRQLGLALPEQGAATLVVEDAGALDWALAEGLVGPGTLAFAPEGSTTRGAATLVEYQGSLVETGGEAKFGEDFFLQVQAYGIAGFLALLGPTAIRVTDEDDLEAFLADADAALVEGTFPEVLTNPAVQLADVSALGGAAPADGARLRLYVDGEGAVRVGPQGAEAGRVGATWQPGPGGFGPERLPVPAELQQDVKSRAWLGRYHSALQTLQSLRARGLDDLEVSGFGVRFHDGLPLGASAPDLALPEAPVLVRSGESYFVHEPDGRTFQAKAETVLTLERALVEPEAAEDTELWQQALGFLNREAGA